MGTSDKKTSISPGRGPRRRLLPRRFSPAWWVGIAAIAGVALVTADFAVEYSLARVPLPPEVKLPSTSEVYDRRGRLIATYRNEVTRFIIDTKELPSYVREAVIAAEDRDFFEHEGISTAGMFRAAWANITSGEVEQGGSTITQQYIKNAVLKDPSRTVERKFKEAILAIKLERRYSKEEILDFYLNTVYFGRGSYGIEAAAGVYFAKDAKDLTLHQAAYLAGLIPAPSAYQAIDDGTARRNNVLEAMHEEGYITADQLARASAKELSFKISKPLRADKQPAAYFLEWLRKDFLYPRFKECLYQCGLKIYTTIDLEMQRQAERAIATTLNEKTDPAAALVAMTPEGAVRAIVGGEHYTNVRKARGFNFAVDSKRQAGSAFKPFTLARAYEENISPSSRFSGASPNYIEDPACVGPDGVWAPENYGGASYGMLDLWQGTANSVNTVYAELISAVGPSDVAGLLERFGFTGHDGEIPEVCSLALGTMDVSVLEMTRAYAGFAGRGALPKVTPIRWVEGPNGRCLLGYSPPDDMRCRRTIDSQPEQVLDQNAADLVNQTLEGVIEYGTGMSAAIGRPVAGKTGTTQDNRDAWFAGYTPQLATVVWMGYPVEEGKRAGPRDDLSPVMGYSCEIPEECRPVRGIDVTGGSFPAAMWAAFMGEAMADMEIEYFVPPYDLPDIVLNPPPPPEPEKKKDKDDDDEGNNGRGRGNDDD